MRLIAVVLRVGDVRSVSLWLSLVIQVDNLVEQEYYFAERNLLFRVGSLRTRRSVILLYVRSSLCEVLTDQLRRVVLLRVVRLRRLLFFLLVHVPVAVLLFLVPSPLRWNVKTPTYLYARHPLLLRVRHVRVLFHSPPFVDYGRARSPLVPTNVSVGMPLVRMYQFEPRLNRTGPLPVCKHYGTLRFAFDFERHSPSQLTLHLDLLKHFEKLRV